MTNTPRKRQRALETPMPTLPEEIIVDILLMLHGKSMCRFRCVCKHWYNLSKDPHFLRNRIKHSIENEKLNCFSIQNNEFHIHITQSTSISVFEKDLCGYVEMESPLEHAERAIAILGSCKGLILMRSFDDFGKRSHWLWNPYTKECKEIASPAVKYGASIVRSVTYGFGYDCDTDDYTIMEATCYDSVYIYNTSSVCYGCEIQIYALEPNSWRTLPKILPYEILSMCGMAEAVFVCGAFHWIASPLHSTKTCIVSFDIHGDKFNEVAVTSQVDLLLNENKSPPKAMPHHFERNHNKALGVVGGCLCIIQPYGGFNIAVWVMKDYNVVESWTKLFVTQLSVVANPIGHVKLLWEFKNGGILFVTTKGSNGGNPRLVYCDLLSPDCQVTRIRHIPGNRWNIEAYAENSLVSLDRISCKRPTTYK